VLILEENSVVFAWVLFMQGVGVLVNLQQLKMKVVELIQTRPTPFIGGAPETSQWY
jgi:hypothetical protein